MSIRKPVRRYGWNGAPKKITVGSTVRYRRELDISSLDEDYTLMADPDIILPSGDFYGEVLDGPEAEGSEILWEVVWSGVEMGGTPLEAWWTYEQLMEIT